MVGLDPKAIKELKEVVVELRDQGTTVLISTHMLEMVEGIWDVMFAVFLKTFPGYRYRLCIAKAPQCF